MKISLKDGIYVAKDKDNSIFTYTIKPSCATLSWTTEGTHAYLDQDHFNIPDLGDWRDSLHVVKNGKLVKVFDKPDIAVYTPVWVKDNYTKKWYASHFAGWEEATENILIFADGTTQHSCGSKGVESWSEWTLEAPYNEK